MRTGYWVECVPLRHSANENFSADLYSASIDLLPEIESYGPSPDQAIERVRAKLKTLKKQYRAMERPLPTAHNRHAPTSRLKAVDGWMSIYIDLDDLER